MTDSKASNGNDEVTPNKKGTTQTVSKDSAPSSSSDQVADASNSNDKATTKENTGKTNTATSTKQVDAVSHGSKANNAANKADNVTNTQTTVEPSRQMQVEENKQSNSVGILAILFSLAALAGVGMTWYQSQVADVRSESGLAVGITEIGGQVSRIGDTVSRLQEQRSNIVSEDKLNATLQQATNDLNASLEQTSTEIDRKIDQFNQKIEQVDQAQSQLFESVTTLNNDLKSGTNAYLVDEVAQLLKLANNSLVYAADHGSALNALTVAAAQLKSITDPRYSAVKVKIAEEIALLKNLELVDVEGMSASLNAISANIPSLPLENEPEATAIDLSQEPTEEVGWRGELSELWSEVKGSIQVHQVERAPKPLLAPEQRYFLDQNLQLMLAKADLGLLQERDVIFQQSIDSASKWLLDYFDTDNAEVKNVLAQLNQLRDSKVSIEMPTITGSYQALQAIKGGQ